MPSPSERAALISTKGGYGLHETTLERLEGLYEGLALKFAKIMQPFGDDIILFLSGHHLFQFSGVSDHLRGINSDELICKKLGCTYGGTIGLMRLMFPQADRRVDIWAHHGFGSARTIGAKINKRLRALEGFRPNIVLMGHDDSKFSVDLQQVVMDDDGTLHDEEVYLVGTGSFQKAYELGKAHGGYAEQQAFSPNGLGAIIFRFELFKQGGRTRLAYARHQ